MYDYRHRAQNRFFLSSSSYNVRGAFSTAKAKAKADCA